MAETKKFGLTKIIGIVTAVLVLASFVLYFVPFWTFPVLKTVGTYDEDTMTVYIDGKIEQTTASLAEFIWFPTSSVKSDAVDSASLEVKFYINENAGYKPDTSALDEFLLGNKPGVDYYANTEAYIESTVGEGSGNAKLGLNAMILFPVFHMVLCLVGAIVCACMTKTPHVGYFSAVIAIWGIISYLSQAHLIMTTVGVILLVLSILTLVTSGVSIFISIVRIRKWLAERRIKLEKMGLR